MCIIIAKYNIENDTKNKHNIRIFIIFILFPNLHFILPKNEHNTKLFIRLCSIFIGYH